MSTRAAACPKCACPVAAAIGHQSDTGELFVERMLTTVTTLRLQGRNVWRYLVEICEAGRLGRAAPSVLSQAAR